MLMRMLRLMVLLWLMVLLLLMKVMLLEARFETKIVVAMPRDHGTTVSVRCVLFLFYNGGSAVAFAGMR